MIVKSGEIYDNFEKGKYTIHEISYSNLSYDEMDILLWNGKTLLFSAHILRTANFTKKCNIDFYLDDIFLLMTTDVIGNVVILDRLSLRIEKNNYCILI